MYLQYGVPHSQLRDWNPNGILQKVKKQKSGILPANHQVFYFGKCNLHLPEKGSFQMAFENNLKQNLRLWLNGDIPIPNQLKNLMHLQQCKYAGVLYRLYSLYIQESLPYNNIDN